MNKLYGAILGDLAGQPYEFPAMKHFPKEEDINLHNPDSHITDDTLMTLASASYMLGYYKTFEASYKEMALGYNGNYYGKMFNEWVNNTNGTIGTSWGNGCLMRISPLMYKNPFKRGIDYSSTYEKVVESCLCSHSHPKSIMACINLTQLYNAGRLNAMCTKNFVPLKQFEKFEVGAKETIDFVENAIWITKSTHDTMKKVISCGGDTDTNASIVGELMNYMYNDLTKEDIDYVESKLDSFQLGILHEFNKRF